MSDPFSVCGRAFVVTGGAGHIGRHICAGLANAKAHVLCLSSRVGEFNDLLTIGHIPIESVECDVSHEAQVEELIFRFSDKRGRLDGLVNGAVRAPRGIDLDMPSAQFNEGLHTILTHYFTCSRLAVHYMQGGSIVNIASMWGKLALDPKVYLDLKNEPSFAMSAAAGGILGLTRFLASILAKDNVRVNALMPGWFPKKRGPERPDYMKEITSRVPMGRIGQPEELVGAVQFMLSDASSYMTGQELVIDGGYSIR